MHMGAKIKEGNIPFKALYYRNNSYLLNNSDAIFEFVRLTKKLNLSK
jgi:hypothetical protein